jgi:transcriptional regulator with XRE-family HTH domain
MTQLELAARIGVTRAAMSRYVSGEREPRLVTLVRIAEELDVSVDDLVVAESHSVEAALRIVARSTFTEEEKSRLREALKSGVRP